MMKLIGNEDDILAGKSGEIDQMLVTLDAVEGLRV
jgi:hypothetical protein